MGFCQYGTETQKIQDFLSILNGPNWKSVQQNMNQQKSTTPGGLVQY